MKLWNDYFVNANIYGFDVDDAPEFLKDLARVKCFKMDAYSDESINYFLQNGIKLDFAIDDGPHTFESMVYFIKNYIQLLSSDGMLIVEDVQDITWCDAFKTLVPDGFAYEVYDLRQNKNRWDDILFVVKRTSSSIIKKLKICFDIGANIGDWSLKNINSYDKIISVEASEITFDKLSKNVESLQKIIPINYAVCYSKNEYVKFYHCQNDVLSTLNKKWLEGGVSRFNSPYTEILCKTISIDKLVEIYGVPDLIKIDVESAEFECIKSMSKKYSDVCFEWASEFLDNTLNCLNHVHKLGYRKFYIQTNSDEYTFRPNENDYFNIEKAKEILCKTIPKCHWGMIWCN
jgi:FkbM family methyltransferase